MKQNAQTPLLTVVVAIVSDTINSGSDVAHLAECLEALTQQIDPPTMEVIVPFHPRVEGIEQLQGRFPDVAYIPVNDLKGNIGEGGSREHHDELRARGLAVAQGEVVALLEDVGRPDSHWCARLMEAHQGDYAAVGGAIENGIDRVLNWAVYFCDFYRYLNPVPETESAFASDANISYKRSALQSTRAVWQDAFHETEVNGALWARGEKLALSPRMIVYQHRRDLRLGNAIKERYIWGRSYAATRSNAFGTAKRIVYAVLSLALPLLLLIRMTLTVARKGRRVGAFLKAFPLTALLTLSWSLGELVGYLTARTTGQRIRTGDMAV